MPEGPEVKTIVNVLSNIIKGSIVTNVIIDSKYKYNKDIDIWLSNIMNYPIIKDIECKGKNIFFKFTFADISEKYIYLHSHLGMTGKWLLKPQKYTKITLELNQVNDSFLKLYYDDVRKYGRLTWMKENEYTKKIKDIGLDMLGDVSIKEWKDIIKKIIQNKRIKPKQVCEFLMSQKWISGIGNYLKAEILYISKIRPDRLINLLKEEEIELLYKVTKNTIKSSYLSQGSYGIKGTFKKMIYGKKIDPKGYKIIISKFKDNRNTYWVPNIQK